MGLLPTEGPLDISDLKQSFTVSGEKHLYPSPVSEEREFDFTEEQLIIHCISW